MKNLPDIRFEDQTSDELTLNSTYVADEDVEDILIAIEAAKVQKKMAQDLENQLKEQLLEIVHEASEIKDHTGYTLATWEPYSTSSFDRKKFDKHYPGVYESYVTHGEARRLLIKSRPMK